MSTCDLVIVYSCNNNFDDTLQMNNVVLQYNIKLNTTQRNHCCIHSTGSDIIKVKYIPNNDSVGVLVCSNITAVHITSAHAFTYFRVLHRPRNDCSSRRMDSASYRREGVGQQ